MESSTDYPIRIELVSHDLRAVLPVYLLQAVLRADSHQLFHHVLNFSFSSSWTWTVFPTPKTDFDIQADIILYSLFEHEAIS